LFREGEMMEVLILFVLILILLDKNENGRSPSGGVGVNKIPENVPPPPEK